MDQISHTTFDDQLSLDPLSLLDNNEDDGSKRSDEPLNEAGYGLEAMSNEDGRGCEEEPEYVHDEFQPLNELPQYGLQATFNDDGKGCREEPDYYGPEAYTDGVQWGSETLNEPQYYVEEPVDNAGRSGWEEPSYEPEYVHEPYQDDGRGQEEQAYEPHNNGTEGDGPLYEPYEDDGTGWEETPYEPYENDGRGWEEQPSYEPQYCAKEPVDDAGRSGWEEPTYEPEYVHEPYQDDGRGQEEQAYEPYENNGTEGDGPSYEPDEDDDTGWEETPYEPYENDGRGWEEQPSYEPYYVSRQFEQDYICFPISDIDKHHLEDGNKVIMPASALGRLMDLRIEEYPMVFEINSPSTGRVSHCGVLEFSAEEGFVLLPNWMMMNMKLQEGDMVNLRNVSLPKGEYMKIQPHETKFVMNIKNPKDVLEAVLKDFTCVSAGDTIMITHEGQKYYIDIVETKPSYGVSLFETDCEVEFATPLDYKEPEKKPASVIESKKIDQRVEEKEEPKFKAFTGAGRRLDGQIIVKNIEVNEPNAAMKLEKKADVEDNEKSSKVEGKLFQPFTGKKYTLGG